MEYLLDEWNYEKNQLEPKDYLYGSGEKVWWKCKRGHEWQTRISVRTIQKSSCPVCRKGAKSSFPEQAIFYYLRNYYGDVDSRNYETLGMELDIFLSQFNIGVEYDGYHWHKSLVNIERDRRKDKLCKDNGIKLIRVRERCLPVLEDSTSIIRLDNKSESDLNRCIVNLLLMIDPSMTYDVNVDRDRDDIYALYAYDREQKSLAACYPELLEEWDYAANIISPDEVSAHSHFMVHWCCKKCGYKWIADVHNRTGKVHAGCPACSRKQIANKQKNKIINLDTNEVFNSLREAADMYGLTKTAISKCATGETKRAGGYRWSYVNGKRPQRKVKFRSSQKVLNIDTGDVYESLVEAARITGISNISAVCRGVRPTAGGYHWKYVDE